MKSFFDIQVNGYAGVDFNRDDLGAEDLNRACGILKGEGVGGILATIITAPLDAMCRRIARLARLRETDPLIAEIVAGIHVEGPFLNEEPGYIGAHPVDAAVPASVEDMQPLLDAGEGLVRIVTLAPERDSGFSVTHFLAQQGITVAAGHCNPTTEELHGAIDAGLSLFTHLGNGCPMHLHRHDNIIQRVLSLSGRLWISFIPDGVHVPFPALGNYLRCCGLERVIMVTDTIAAAGLGPGTYTLGNQDIRIGDDLVARAPDASHFIGSTVTWPRLVENLSQHLGLSPDEITRVTTDNPRQAAGIPESARNA